MAYTSGLGHCISSPHEEASFAEAFFVAANWR
jgi:hypothetical protein